MRIEMASARIITVMIDCNCRSAFSIDYPEKTEITRCPICGSEIIIRSRASVEE